MTGLSDEGAQRIVTARDARLFADLVDCCRRTQLPRRIVEHLILAGAFDAWGQPRRALLWELGMVRYEVAELDLPLPSSPVAQPPLEIGEAEALQMALLGVSTGEHPLARWRAALEARGYVSSLRFGQCAGGSGCPRAGGAQAMLSCTGKYTPEPQPRHLPHG